MSVTETDTFLLSRAGSVFRVAFAELRAAMPQPAWGRVNSNGTAARISGASVSRTATGRYAITLTQPQADASYPILVSLEQNAGRDDYVTAYRNVTATGFTVEVSEQDNSTSSGAYRDAGFSFFIPASIPD